MRLTKCKIKTQRSCQNIGKSGSNRARFNSDPSRRDGRKRNQISKRGSQPEIFVGHHSQCAWIAPGRADFSLPEFKEELLRRNEEGVLL